MGKRLYVGNLSYDVDSSSLEQLFSAHGTVQSAEVVSDRLRYLFLAHLSRDCNKPELAQDVVGKTLRQLGATHVQLAAASQDHPSNTVSV